MVEVHTVSNKYRIIAPHALGFQQRSRGGDHDVGPVEQFVLSDGNLRPVEPLEFAVFVDTIVHKTFFVEGADKVGYVGSKRPDLDRR